jgi:hypothetical protein
MISRLEIITTSISASTTSMMTVSFSGDRRGGLVADAGDQRLQRGLAAEGGFDQVPQLDQEVHHVHRLRGDQAQVQRQLQPAAGEDQVGQGAQRGGLGGGGPGSGFAGSASGLPVWRHCRGAPVGSCNAN